MGESRCFLCREGFGGRGRWPVRAFLPDGSCEDGEACASWRSVGRGCGEVKSERGGETLQVRERFGPMTPGAPQ